MSRLKGLIGPAVDALADQGMSRAQIADGACSLFADAAVSKAQIDRWCSDQEGALVSSLAFAAFLATRGHEQFLRAANEAAGFLTVRKPAPGTSPCVAMVAAMGEVFTSSGAIAQEVAAAVADGQISEEEIERVRARVRAEQAAGEMLLASMDLAARGVCDRGRAATPSTERSSAVPAGSGVEGSFPGLSQDSPAPCTQRNGGRR